MFSPFTKSKPIIQCKNILLAFVRSVCIVQVYIHLPYIYQTVNYNNFPPEAVNGLGLSLCVNYRGCLCGLFRALPQNKWTSSICNDSKVFYRSWESVN